MASRPGGASYRGCRRGFDAVADGRDLLATLVRVPETDGTFLEVETAAADEAGPPAALAVVRSVLAGLGIGEDDLTTEQYTDAVAAVRRPRVRHGRPDESCGTARGRCASPPGGGAPSRPVTGW